MWTVSHFERHGAELHAVLVRPLPSGDELAHFAPVSKLRRDLPQWEWPCC